jgi:hypothetical protein
MTAKRSINSPSGTCRSTASVSLYNADGYYEKNEYNAYTLNNITAKKGGDGSVTIPVRRLQRQHRQLPANDAGLELHGSPLSAARRGFGPHMEIPGGAARKLIAKKKAPGLTPGGFLVDR